MKNLFYYLTKYGNKSFDEFPFNEVDSLILSQLSYLNFDLFAPTIENKEKPKSLQAFLNSETIEELCKETLDEKRNIRLLNILTITARYQGLYVNYYQNHFRSDTVEQFCAITFIFKKFIYVAYRGTDLSLLGWRENFNMSFLEAIPSQKDASIYLNLVAEYTDKPLYIGGHSKGGNLAVYAAIYTSKYTKKRIIKIYDHDGPGFNVDIFSTPEYLEIEERIEKTTCKESRVGILLQHSEKMNFVDSRSFGIFQHDPFNWKITADGRFKLVKQAKLTSIVFEKTVNNFIEITAKEDRKLFLEIVFKMAVESDNEIIFDLQRHPIRYAKRIKRNYKLLTESERKLFKQLIKRYRNIWSQNVKYYLRRKIRFKDR